LNFIADVLTQHLPKQYPQASAAIYAALPPRLNPTKSDDDFGRFIYAPLGIYVENHGLAEKDLNGSLELIEALTQRFSMEFSLRPFLNQWPLQTLARMDDWCGHAHYHVRRLVSEASRPKLPWAPKIKLPFDAALPFLDKLQADPTRYVTRSVANHLNDITKIDKSLVINRLAQWRKSAMQHPKETEWMIRHACRGLIKAGDSAALELLGFRLEPALRKCELRLNALQVARGGRLTFEALLEVDREEPLLVDYVIDFVKANGQTKPKVFKWKTLIAKPGEPLQLSKSHFFKDGASTFSLYPGTHGVRLQVNGKLLGHVAFEMT